MVTIAAASISARADFESASMAYRNHAYEVAFAEFLPLARNGDPRAQTIIAMMYKYGESVRQDYKLAFKWYLAAAEKGYPSAQLSLSELYENGQGVDQDHEKARYWLEKSAEQGSKRAKRRASAIKNTGESDPSSVFDSQDWSREWNFKLPANTQVDNQTPISVNPAIATGSYWVQLGAMRSSASANRLWINTSEPNQDLFEGLQYHINSSKKESGGFFRLRTGPFNSLEKAQSFCNTLSKRGLKTGCLPVKSM
jgi:TPR repeat protein